MAVSDGKQNAMRDVRKRLTKVGLPEKFRVVLDFPSSSAKLRRVFPFRKSWFAILMLAAFDAIFMVPAITTFGQVTEEWSKLESLFDLTSAVFLSAWLLGWSVAPLIMTLILLLMLTGREVLKVRHGTVEIGIGIPGLLFSAEFAAGKMANLRHTVPDPKSGTSWRGSHMSFDYNGRQIDFGSDVREADVLRIARQIQSAAGVPIASKSVSTSVAAAGETEIEEADDTAQSSARRELPAAAPSTASSTENVSLASPATWSLILANLVPIFGALFLGWRLSDVMVLYWAESGVIGFYNLLKLVVIEKWLALVMGPFFVGHFGAFMAVHFLFLYSLFVEGPGAKGGGDLQQVAAMFIDLWPALAALFISHGISFGVNFLGKKEYQRISGRQQMAAPYSRVIFMHLVLIFGGFVVMLLGDPVPVLLLVIILKIAVDVRTHLRLHAG